MNKENITFRIDTNKKVALDAIAAGMHQWQIEEIATWYGPMVTKEGVPIEENIRTAEEAFRQRVEQENQRKKDSQS